MDIRKHIKYLIVRNLLYEIVGLKDIITFINCLDEPVNQIYTHTLYEG